jgi:hypothetical protein
VEVIQTDNGPEFGASFHWHVLDRGAGHVYIKPRTPRLNGKVERSHRIDAEEFYRLLDGVVIDDAQVFNDTAARPRTSDSRPSHVDRFQPRRPTRGRAGASRPLASGPARTARVGLQNLVGNSCLCWGLNSCRLVRQAQYS